MGTHPIFESDFDCLTDNPKEQTMPGRGPGSQASAKQKKDNQEEVSLPGDQEPDGGLAAVIDGPDVQSLAINYDELEQIRVNLIETAKRVKSPSNAKKVMVRREKKEIANPKQKRKILVTRRGSATGEPVEVQKQTPLSLDHGEINENMILGSRDQFIRSALKNGDLDETSPLAKSVMTPETQQFLAEEIYNNGASFFEPVSAATRQHAQRNETHALDNWRAKMIERKRVAGRISKLVNKSSGELVQSSADTYRARQEQRDVIDRAIPSIDYGKGYRVGSEFWRQYESIGDDMGGLKMSLKVSERGQPVDVTRIGKPDLIKVEVGENYEVKDHHNHTGGYMATRRAEVEHILDEFDAYEPAYADLIVLGKEVGSGASHAPSDTTDGKNEMDDVVEGGDLSSTPSDHVPGPGLAVNGASMAFGQNEPIDTCIYFDRFRGEMEVKQLRLTNIGVTTVYYNWSRQYRARSFQSQRPDQTQRFYFNASPGSVLPGQTKLIPIVFESPNGGKFAENWHLNCRPQLGTFNIILRGCSQSLEPEHDENLAARAEIERTLERQQARSAASHVINRIMQNVKTPPRSPSPDERYATEADRFERANARLHYDYVSVRELDAIWSGHSDENDEEWDLSLRTLRRRLIDLSEQAEENEELEELESAQDRLNQLCRHMYQSRPTAPPLTATDRVRMELNHALEKITGQFIQMRRKMSIAQTSPFPLLEERPTSSQMSMTSAKGRVEEKPKKTASATKKEKSAGKGGRKQPEQSEKEKKKKKNSKTDVKTKKNEKDDENARSNTSPMSSYSEMDAGGLNLNDQSNVQLKHNYQAKAAAITHELLDHTIHRIASILSTL